jgi:hypothetical protein
MPPQRCQKLYQKRQFDDAVVGTGGGAESDRPWLRFKEACANEGG